MEGLEGRDWASSLSQTQGREETKGRSPEMSRLISRSIGIVYPWMVLQIDKRQRRIDCITGNIEIPPQALRRAMNTRTSRYASESGSSFDIPVTLITGGGNLVREYRYRVNRERERRIEKDSGQNSFSFNFLSWLFL